MEIFVDYNNGFNEILIPASQFLKNYFIELNVLLPKGFQAEINTEAIQWIKGIAASLNRGYVITIDYGYPSHTLYDERRSNGTIMCYYQHDINDSPYVNIGGQDITAHVNYSALYHWGLINNLDLCGLTDQSRFLLSLGIIDHFNKVSIPDNITAYRKQAFLRHTLLVDMGSKFKVMIQSKNVANKELSGLQYKPAFHMGDIGAFALQR